MAVGLIAASGAVVLPGALNRFVLLKSAVLCTGLALMWLATARGRLPRAAWVLVAVAAAGLAIGTAASAAPLTQLIGRGPRYEGAAMAVLYVLCLVAGARLLGPLPRPEVDRAFAHTLAVVAMLIAGLAVLESLGLRPLPSSSDRPGSLLGNASDQGVWGVLVLGPLLAAAVTTRSRWLAVGGAAAAATVVLSASRGALLGGLVVLVALIAIAGRRGQRLALAGTGVALLLSAVLLPSVADRVAGESPLAAQTVQGRQLLWQETFGLLSRTPLTGVGPSGYADAITTAHTPQWYEQVGPQFPPDSPHNWVLQAWSAGGLLTLGAAIGACILIAATAVRARKADGGLSLRTGAAAGLAGYGTALLFHFTSPAPTSLAVLLAGALLSTAPRRAAPRGVAIAATAATAALALVLLSAAIAEIPLRRGIEAATAGVLDEADQHFATASALRPWDVEVDLLAGHAFAVLASTGQIDAADRAEPWLGRAERRLPHSVPLMSDLALVEEARGNFAGAGQRLDDALAIDPYNPDLWLQRGIVYAKSEDYLASERAFLQAADFAPTSPDPWLNLAELYAYLGETDKADKARTTARALTRP